LSQHVLRLIDLRLSPDGETHRLPPANRIAYCVNGGARVNRHNLAANQAAFESGDCAVSSADMGAHLLCWELVSADTPAAEGETLSAPIPLEPDEAYLMRCDRVDFPPGGVAYLHTHQGPGIRCLIAGTIRIETEVETLTLEPWGPWFEAGPAPVFAAASESLPTAFVRVMILPRRLEGQSSIRYVNADDQEKPKSQRYTVFVDEPIEL
jgi:hypothetical protein